MALIIGSAIGFMIVLFVVLTLAAFLCVIEDLQARSFRKVNDTLWIKKGD